MSGWACCHCGREVVMPDNVHEDMEIVCAACDGPNTVMVDDIAREAYFADCQDAPDCFFCETGIIMDEEENGE